MTADDGIPRPADLAAIKSHHLDARKLFGIDESGRAGFHDVRLKVDLSGPHTPEEYDNLRKAVDEHCPVFDLFANPVPVSGALV